MDGGIMCDLFLLPFHVIPFVRCVKLGIDFPLPGGNV